MEIRTKRGEINKLAELTGFSRQAVSRALRFKTNTEESRRIRNLAITRGGVASID